MWSFTKRNLKIELFIIGLLVMAVVLRVVAGLLKLNDMTWWYDLRLIGLNFFTNDRLNLFSGFFSIICGIYLAIITIIGTSVIGITKDLLREKLDKDLIDLFMFGLIENIICVVICILSAGVSGVLFYILITGFFAITFTTLIKFVIIIRRIFLANLEQTAKNLDEEERQKQEIINRLIMIEEHIK